MSDKSNSLICAVREGDLERAKTIIDSFGLSYLQAWSKGYVLLCDAIKKKHTAIIKLLLTNGSEVNSTKRNSNTPLHFAAINSDIEIVKMLLDRGANINDKNQEGITSLYNAIENENIEIIELLLNRGADVNARFIKGIYTSKEGYTPLHFAVDKGHETIVKMLVDRGANIDAKDQYGTPLFNAIKNKNIEITELLLNLGADVNVRDIKGYTPLHVAAKKGQETIVKMLLNRGANIDAKNEYGETPLHTAIRNENMTITDLLLNSGANVNVKDNNGLNPLHSAARKGYLQIVEHLLEHNADVNSVITMSDRRLFQHFPRKRYDICYTRYKRNNVNVKENLAGKTALHIATQEYHKEVVEVLLKCGAKVDSKDENDRTPLHIAAAHGNLEIVEVLLKFGADIDSKDGGGRTALHIASEIEYTDIVIVLLEHGSDVNIINKHNDTPLDVVMNRIVSFFNRIEDDNSDDFYFNRIFYPRKQIAEILIQHIVKIKTANLYISEQNLSRSNNYKILYLQNEYEESLLRNIGSSNNKIRDFTKECEKEVAIMKTAKINNTTISFYDILTKSTNSLATYMRNENIVQVLESDDYKTKFSIYASMVKNNFKKGMERKKLLEHGNKCFHFLFNNFPELPHHCSEKIISYLSDKDLRSLIDACTCVSSNTDINNVAITSNISRLPYV